jgi:hypothetical protein
MVPYRREREQPATSMVAGCSAFVGLAFVRGYASPIETV